MAHLNIYKHSKVFNEVLGGPHTLVYLHDHSENSWQVQNLVVGTGMRLHFQHD